MFSGSAFAKFIGVSQKLSGQNTSGPKFLASASKGDSVFPDGKRHLTGFCCQSFQSSSICLVGDSWTVYRFLTQHHPELEGDIALSALQHGKVSRALTTDENASSRFS
jgi:hypothetical protein